MRRWVTASGRLVALVLLPALLALWPQSARALTPSQVYDQVKDSVVVVRAYDRAGKAVGLGSGVVLPSGDIVTNHHVIKLGVRYTVGQGGKTTPATLKADDPDNDLALLSAPGLGAQPARLGRAGALKVGEKVYAVGAPAGLELSLSEGIVAQLRGGPPPIIQTTAAISPGSSGGGLFNDRGELVGITTLYLEGGQNLNFALPVEWLGQLSGKTIRAQPRAPAPAVPEPGTGTTGNWLDRADALFDAQDWQGLLAHCRRWTRAEPVNADAWFGLGAAYGGLGRYQEAVAAYREALRLQPDYPIAWKNLGAAYGRLGRYGESITASREALRLKPDYAEAWNNLGVAYFLSGNRSAALEAVKELRRYDPQKADKMFNMIMKP